nr:MAG TPA: hypothetical protein [Caudoviricetes sp.]
MREGTRGSPPPTEGRPAWPMKRRTLPSTPLGARWKAEPSQRLPQPGSSRARPAWSSPTCGAARAEALRAKLQRSETRSTCRWRFGKKTSSRPEPKP